jgi:hypothetical protein
MKHLRFASVITGGAIAAAALVTLTAAAAQATTTPLAVDQTFCQALRGSFTSEVFGGQTNSTCTFTVADGTHHLHYENGLFTGSD